MVLCPPVPTNDTEGHVSTQHNKGKEDTGRDKQSQKNPYTGLECTSVAQRMVSTHEAPGSTSSARKKKTYSQS